MRGNPPSCTASAFTAHDPFIASAQGAGWQQQVRFAGPLDGGGFALAWLSRGPADGIPSWRAQWQGFDTSGHALQAPFELPYAEDVPAPLNVAMLVLPQGRAIVAYAVNRTIDVARPTVVANSILLFDNGVPVGTQITVATQTLELRSRPASYSRPLLAPAGDGGVLVGWHLVGMVKPELFVQQVAADGTNVGDLVRIDAFTTPASQLLGLPSGGWVALTPWRTPPPESRDFTLVTQVGTARQLHLPAQLPPRSVLLQDERGLLVASGASSSAGPSLQQLNPAGHSAGKASALAATPIAALGLPGGAAAVVMADGGAVALQRVDARGEMAGPPLATSAPADALAGALPGGGLVLAWARDTPSESLVMAQVFTPPCPP